MQKALQNLSQDRSPGKAEIGENRDKNLGLGGVGVQLTAGLELATVPAMVKKTKQNSFHLD